MPYYTPLRYPGGKRRLASVIVQLLEENGLTDIEYFEPYAGGSAVALALLFEEHASTVYINDLSRPIFAFWHMVLNETEEFCRRILSTSVTIEEWLRQRKIYEERETSPLDDLGFAALFLNRTNRSGNIGGGVIGGLEQNGAWKIDARFNSQDLVRRIRKIGRYRDRVTLSQKFIKNNNRTMSRRKFFFIDPPYVENSEGLYLNTYVRKDHELLARGIVGLKSPWLLTYDAAVIDLKLYDQYRAILYGLTYSARNRYEGKEIMFFSKNLRLPETWMNAERVVLTPPRISYPLYGALHSSAI
jgi:DNA adenine methylase